MSGIDPRSLLRSRERGATDFRRYAVDPTQPLLADLFLDDPELGQGLHA